MLVPAQLSIFDKSQSSMYNKLAKLMADCGIEDFVVQSFMCWNFLWVIKMDAINLASCFILMLNVVLFDNASWSEKWTIFCLLCSPLICLGIWVLENASCCLGFVNFFIFACLFVYVYILYIHGHGIHTHTNCLTHGHIYHTHDIL